MAKNRLDFQAHLSRHSHDISAGYTSSIAPGMIVPQYFHVLGPGDSIYYSNKIFARLQDVVTAFKGEIDIHIDSFFVPLQMLFTPFGQIFAQTDDFISNTFMLANLPAQKDAFPLFDIDSSAEELAPNVYDYVQGESQVKSMARLLDALNANPLKAFSSKFANDMQYDGDRIDDRFTVNPYVSPWIFAAYQAIYQKYYRNDEVEHLNVGYYNFDSEYANSTFENQNYLQIRYVQRPKDYFTNVRVSPIASAVNKFGNDITQFPVNGANLDSILYKVDSFLTSKGFDLYNSKFNTIPIKQDYTSFDSVSTAVNYESSNTSILERLTASNVRALFAVDKFARIYGRADKTYDDQILAHFGIKIPHDVKHDLTHLSHFRAVLQSDPIYSTANTVNGSDDQISALGQVGGQGSVDVRSNQDKFTAPVHGVFMVVAYVVTKPRYCHTFSRLHLLNTRLMFPIPEYDKLGAQPLYAFEANPTYLSTQQAMTKRIGWIDRYAQFKHKYNRASMTYFNGVYSLTSQGVNIYAPWVISRLPFDKLFISQSDTSQFVDARLLFESPSSLNDIMVAKFEDGWDNAWFNTPFLMFQSDPILTEFMCDCKLVSWLSETGEPDL